MQLKLLSNAKEDTERNAAENQPPIYGINGILLRGYGAAVAFVFLAWLSTRLLNHNQPERAVSLSFFFAAVALSAGYRGVGPGIAATILSALVYDYFFLPPYRSFEVTGGDLALLMLFVLVAGLINALAGRLQAGTKEADRRFQLVAQEMAALNSITAAVSASLELPTVLNTLKHQLSERLTVPGGCILLCDAEESLRLADAWGLPAEMYDLISALNPDDLYDLSESPHSAEAALPASYCLISERILHELGWRGQMVVPLMANNKLEGALCLLSHSRADLSDERSRFFSALGRQVGVLIQNARLYEQVRAGQDRLHHLSRQLVSVQEAERREIARELHDEVGQVLTGLKLSLEMGGRGAAEATGNPMPQALALVNELMAHVQDLSLNLRPAMLDDLGLLPALLWHFDRYSLSTGIHVRYEHSGIERRFPPEIETAAYRVVQEALTNVARHAGVAEVIVRLWTAPHSLCVQIADRGRGFCLTAPTRVGAGGLAGMEERVTLLGGQLTIESAPNSGTRLQAELPLDPASDNDACGDLHEHRDDRIGR